MSDIYSYRPSTFVKDILRNSNILKIYYLNSLIDYSLVLFLEKLQKENKDYKFLKKIDVELIEKIKSEKVKRTERNYIIELRKSDTRKAYLFKNFIYRLRQFLKDNINKKHLENILNNYLLEAKTYEDFEKETEKIKKINDMIKRKTDLTNLKELLEIEINFIETQSIKNELMVKK